MKKCPQCNNVFPDGLIYCTHDGTPLLTETLSMPSEFSVDVEEPTVIRHEPIVIDFSAQNLPTEQINYGEIPPTERAAPIVVVRQRSTVKYLLFLITGLIFGGVLVLGVLLLAKNYYQENASVKTINVNAVNAKTSGVNNAAVNREAKTPTSLPTVEQPLNSEHQTKTSADDAEFNGRVIVSNAYVRSSPSKTAAQADILPVNDRLHIERRENESSPWFYIICEHGASGWMHGNTIEYTQ